MDIKQLKAAIKNAPEDTTHVCLENGTHYQFKIKGLSAEVYGDGEWVSYDGCALPDLENVSLLSDIKNIVKMCEILDKVTTSVSESDTVHALSCISIDNFLQEQFSFFTQK